MLLVAAISWTARIFLSAWLKDTMSAHHPTRSLLIDSAFRLARIAVDKSLIPDIRGALESLRRSRLLFEQLIIELAPLASDGSRISADSVRDIVSAIREIECSGDWDALGLLLEQSHDAIAMRQNAA